MAGGGAVSGWDYSRYGDPRFFLQTAPAPHLHRRVLAPEVRRQRRRGRLGLPGGQPARSADRRAAAGAPQAAYFDWAHGLEKPLGRNPEYHG